MKQNQRKSKTILSATLLLVSAACISIPPAEAPTSTAVPSPTITNTQVWFPPTPTPSPFPTAVLSPTPDLRTGIGELQLADDFSDSADWSLSSDNNASVTISNGSLNLSLKSNDDLLLTTRTSPTFSNFYAEITATTNFCQGEDEYGLIVRALDGDHYRLALSCDGRVKIDRFYNGGLSRQAGWLTSGAVPAVAPGTSRLAVWAAGSQMRFFVNDLYVFTLTDSLLYKGTIGVFVHTAGEGDVSVSFSNLEVWDVNR